MRCGLITTALQRRWTAKVLGRCCYSRDIVRFNDARRTRLRSLVAVMAAAWVLVVVTDSGLPWLELSAPHPPHATAASHWGEFAAVVDHPHLKENSVPESSKAFTAAVLPRASMGLVALGLIAAVVAICISFAQPVLPAMRGPPRAAGAVCTGRQVVTRFCISRR
jgi:hypothetical protein